MQVLRERFRAIGLVIGTGLPSVLRALSEKDNITQRELSENCGRDAATLSRALDRLEENGWIKRQTDPDSRRSYRVVLTEAGRPVAQKVQETYRSIDENMCAGFSQDELETLWKDLERIRKNLEDDEASHAMES